MIICWEILFYIYRKSDFRKNKFSIYLQCERLKKTKKKVNINGSTKYQVLESGRGNCVEIRSR